MLESDLEDSAGERDPQAPQPRILMVDDDPYQLVLQSQVLRGLGFQHVQVSERAEAALVDLRADPHAYDVIFCDLNMPGMDGIEFLRALEANHYVGSVVLLSGESTRILHTVQKLLGRDGLVMLGTLVKPAGREAMKAVLAQWRPARNAPPPNAPPVYSVTEVEDAARGNQWVLHYQPKVNLKTGKLAGLEALIRWKHPVHGIVMPDRFIDVAEDCGVIDTLTDWVFHESIAQLAVWRKLGMRLGMAINVSVENLRVPNFERRLAAIVQEAHVAPNDVTLEITESRVMAPAPLETLVRLRLHRFKLSIDDFGTGHSSLAQLRDVPFTELKVDRGFVKGARVNSIIRPILEGSLGLAARLGMQSVAEGVETVDDWHLLRELDCDLAQGYFIGRPAPAEALPAWLAAWEERREELVK